MTNSNDKLAKLAINKSLLKEYRNSENDRIVYLKDGDEFQIQIFNPYQYVIGVSFTFNSDSVDNSKMLVLKPGERVWLDRYLNENKKLKFSTYNVNNSSAVQEAIAKNGIVNMYFYKEQEKNYTIWNNNTYIYDGSWKSPIDDLNGGIRYMNYCLDDSVKLASSIDSVNAINYCDANISTSSLGISDYSCSTACTSASYSTTTADVKGHVDKSSHKVRSKSIETGRIDKGGYSNQQFNNYSGDFNSWYFKKETIKILPESQKQISVGDLTKKYCHNCGKKIKETFKFCPNCGSKQE